MAASTIEWTDETWNPVTGCTRASSGCDFCYAVSMTRRLEAMGVEKYAGLVNEGKKHFNGIVRVHPDTLNAPLRWRKPRRVFVNSMSDLFHPAVPLGFIRQVFEVMEEAYAHAFQVLTKRPERAAELASELPWPPNVLLGTSIEDHRVVGRADALRTVPAAIRFLSCEPLIGPLIGVDAPASTLNLEGIDWVIVGGESGPKARPMKAEWVWDIRDRCISQDVAFFFKQWGRYNAEGQPVGKKRAGRLLDGRTWDEHPAVAGWNDPTAVRLAEPEPLPNEVWAHIAPILPGREGAPGGTGDDNRTFIEAVRWKAHTCRPWRDLPSEYGNWNTVAVRTKRWAEGGHWERVCGRLSDPFVRRLVGA